MNKKLLIVLIITLITSNINICEARQMQDYDSIVIEALNKITGKTSEIKASVNSEVKFGNLNISIFSCQKSSPLDTPESAAFLQVYERQTLRFSGWMFASSPGVSAMDHPVYDIWIKDCFNKENKEEIKN